jgi:tRNA threonylcarbamoyladenosine biosynthesis protein TsaE
MRIWSSASVAATRAVGAEVAAELLPDRALLLVGELGAGKTVLVQGLAGALGIASEEVQSPTYTLMREHRGARGRLIHLDLYRLDADEVAAAGFEEVLLGPGVKAVEWPERMPFPLPGALVLAIESDGERRTIREIPALPD